VHTAELAPQGKTPTPVIVLCNA